MQNSDAIAAGSACISLLAFAIACLQAWYMRQHSRLSVRPLLGWASERARSDDAFDITITLRNDGLGPAVVRERYFTLDGQHFTSPDRRPQVEALVEQLTHDAWNCRIIAHGLPGVGMAIVPGAEMKILHLRFAPIVAEEADLERVLERAGLVVVYEDLYRARGVFRIA